MRSPGSPCALESIAPIAAAPRPRAAIGVGEVGGCLEPGRPADLLVVAGDPLADLAVLGNPSTSSRLVTASSEAAKERADEGRSAATPGLFNEFEGWKPGDAWNRILEIARLGERLGFESLWTAPLSEA